ncbi:MAG: hypothetical protein B6D61_11940 [Bacteroidetes bacterium 4484_249]|nr:MAG: hypothetical protein B6D61_11940 [Bacteroidetes bacterium 4484_249]
MNLATINIKGKEYVTVNERVRAFRELHPDWSIVTDILSNDNGVCIMQATIKDADGNIISTGHAYEKENSSFINSTSYIENAETSCVGRACGFLGIGIASSIATADEVSGAIKQQNAKSLNETLNGPLRKKLVQNISELKNDLTFEEREQLRIGYPEGTKGMSIEELEELEQQLINTIAENTEREMLSVEAS